MPRFDTILSEAGLDPTHVQLVRHQDTRATARTTPYILWKRNREAFEVYQRLQSDTVFKLPSIASFVVPPNGETLFVGIYNVLRSERNAEPVACPVSGQVFAPGTMNLYDLTEDRRLSELRGLLTIEWSGRNWVQRAHTQERKIVELRRHEEEQPFPGFEEMHIRTDELALAPRTWSAILAATGGVYLLVSTENGDQYVGSATGQEGFWSRWEAYAQNGHGGNSLLRTRGRPPYAISILETASSAATREQVIAAEQRWKRKLGSRAFGLNAN